MSTFFVAWIFAFFGLFLGSFAGASVWRLRVRQLKEDVNAGDKVSVDEKKEVRNVKLASISKDRSVCLHCGHQLAWYDLVPLISWVALRGKCRYCRKTIGITEPIVEVAVAIAFAVSYLFWPVALDTPLVIAQFALWLVAIVGLAVLTIYDLKWFLLPNKIVFPLIGVGIAYSALQLAGSNFQLETWLGIGGAVLALSGFYFGIYVVSRQQWVGFGDVKLCLGLALLLADWQLALLALFLANIIGTLLVLPLMVTNKLDRQSRIPFGPLLIAGWFIAGLFGVTIIDWYLTFSL